MSPETYFLCFVQHGAVFKMFAEGYFGLSKWRPQKKFIRSYLQRKKIEKLSFWRLENA